MDWTQIIALSWLVLGILLIAAEFFAPALIKVFLGLSAVMVAGLCWIGLLESVPASLLTWSVISLALVLGVRPLAKRYFPSETIRELADEEAQVYGSIVEVVQPCSEGTTTGRIRFQGTTWPATSIAGEIPAGTRARLLFRDNLAWAVEPVHDLDDGDDDHPPKLIGNP
ncbi:MAG: NfeD family protein [Candidatus Schekmanbacteria bacterium]|nr:NfeD family protein [Candidatus Schekmanbacteria bacterium]